ncbi:protein mono-ADP-ribosyltransferase PARP12-like isoform X2 [Osmerus mordax]|uniref:protein mono-ADP-ribosyltransferase PARP12-like isoform X2 n=1 Tax=Osmerus mordax TaxID=8014 RepID=UPI00350EED68
MESEITKLLCANYGSMNVDKLTFNLSIGDFSELWNLIVNRERFSIAVVDGERTLIAKTTVRLCMSKDCQGCIKLHLCKRFLLGVCHRAVCRFGHDLFNVQNAMVLRENGLKDLNRDELCSLLLLNDNSLLPPVCHSYNNGVGEYGKCPDSENCRRMHICENYLRGACSCPRAHDFFEPHPLKTLQDRGVPNHIIGRIKSIYTSIEALRHQDRAEHGHRPSARAAPADNRGPNRGPQRDKTEICMYYVKGSCKHGDRCFKVHSTLPYQWEVKERRQWTALPNNEEIEKDYCDPSKTYGQGLEPVCFDDMTCGLNTARRLSTISSILQPSFILTTEWLWYWQDESGNWIQYATASAVLRTASITSEDLEQRFQSDDKSDMDFTAGSQSYTLSFKDMMQTNKRFGTRRPVRRRPKFVSLSDAQTIKTSKRMPNNQSNFKALPGHWDKAQTPDTGFKKVLLQTSSSEYKEIEQLFISTVRDLRFHKIERIQNRALWEVFQWQRDLMKKSNGGKNPTEKKLFHGTDSKYIDAICHSNFDWRICGTHGTAYGKGSYFARDAKYSHSYTGQSPVKTMFVSRVLVGDYTRGDSSYLRPPSKDGGDTVFYDSCVDNVTNPSIFVVFEKHQVYPEYLITYGDQPHVQDLPHQAYNRPVPASVSVPAPFSAPILTRAPVIFTASAPSPFSAPVPAQRSTPAPAPALPRPPVLVPAPALARPPVLFPAPAPTLARPPVLVPAPAPTLARPPVLVPAPAPALARPPVLFPAPTIARSPVLVPAPAPALARPPALFPAPTLARSPVLVPAPAPALARSPVLVPAPAPILVPAPASRTTVSLSHNSQIEEDAQLAKLLHLTYNFLPTDSASGTTVSPPNNSQIEQDAQLARRLHLRYNVPPPTSAMASDPKPSPALASDPEPDPKPSTSYSKQQTTKKDKCVIS